MLGVAGGSAINSLRRFYPNIQILGIELDPVIVKVALEYGLFTTNKKTRIKIANAIEWVKDDKNTYDLVIVDLYLGDQNVVQAREDTFLKHVKTLVSPKGIVVYSCHYNAKKGSEYKEFLNRIKKTFPHIETLFEFPKNKILLLKKEEVQQAHGRITLDENE